MKKKQMLIGAGVTALILIGTAFGGLFQRDAQCTEDDQLEYPLQEWLDACVKKSQQREEYNQQAKQLADELEEVGFDLNGRLQLAEGNTDLSFISTK